MKGSTHFDHIIVIFQQITELNALQKLTNTFQEEQKQTNIDVKQQQGKLKDCMSHRVGFMSVMSSATTLAAKQTAVFDKVIYSSGGYDNQTGLFSCSVPGEYHFSVHALSRPTHDIVIDLKLNSVVITTLYVYSHVDIGQGSEGAVIHLNKNDVVSVVSAPCCTSEFYQDVNLVQSNVFTGHLIRSDDCLV